MKSIITEDRQIGVVFIGAIIFCLVLIAVYKDLGLNLFSELVGAIFTVFVIERIYAKRERARLRPLYKSAARDIQLIHVNILHMLMHAVKQGARESDRLVLDGIRNEFGIIDLSPILSRVPMSAYAPVLMAETAHLPNPSYFTWAHFISVETKRLSAMMEKFMERYSAIVEPDTFQAIHNLKDDLAFTVGETLGVQAASQFSCQVLHELPAKIDALAQAVRNDEALLEFYEPERPGKMVGETS